MIVLEPRRLATECFLGEALCYCWMGYLPLDPHPAGAWTASHDRRVQRKLIPSLPTDGWCDFVSDDPRPDFVEGVIDPVQCEKANTRLLVSSMYNVVHDRQSEVERIKCEIFMALNDGALPAKGRKFSSVSQADQAQLLDDVPMSLDPAEYHEIPPTFWRLERIRWFDCIATNEEVAYFHIIVNVDHLLKRFPLRPASDFSHVKLRGRYLVVDDLSDNEISDEMHEILRTRRGRKPMWDWNAFDDAAVGKLTERYSEKVRAMTFASEMLDWCKAAGWEPVPSDNTVYKRVAPLLRLHDDGELIKRSF